MQIRMSSEVEKKIGNFLNNSKGIESVDKSSSASNQGAQQSSPNEHIVNPVSVSEIETAKEKLSAELKLRQESLKVVHMQI